MGEPRGRTPDTLTDPDRTEFHDVVQRRIRDLPPSSGEGPSLSDPDARRGDGDPLDAHKPGVKREDPLDPDGHVI